MVRQVSALPPVLESPAVNQLNRWPPEGTTVSKSTVTDVRAPGWSGSASVT